MQIIECRYPGGDPPLRNPRLASWLGGLLGPVGGSQPSFEETSIAPGEFREACDGEVLADAGGSVP
jgi:hypothetical protein